MNNVEELISTTVGFDESAIYYVYLHYRLDTNTVFYVGKGKGRRAFTKKSRNNHWNNIVNKCGYRVEIIKEGLTEKEAFDLEIEQIKFFGFDNLVNMTLGGNSTTGYEHTEETRKLQSEIALQKLAENPERLEVLNARLAILHDRSRNDAEFKKKHADSVKAYYANLDDEGKRNHALKTTAWMGDEEKLKSARQKHKDTMQKVETREKISKACRDAYMNKSDEHKENLKRLKIDIMNSPNFIKSKMEAICNKTVINGKYLFNSRNDFTLWKGITSGCIGVKSKVASKKFTNDFIIHDGFFVEDYNPLIHTETTMDYSGLERIKGLSFPRSFAIVRSDGKIFMSLKEAAESFGDKMTESTSDWISKCARNNKPAMGFTWSIASKEQVVAEILRLVKENNG